MLLARLRIPKQTNCTVKATGNREVKCHKQCSTHCGSTILLTLAWGEVKNTGTFAGEIQLKEDISDGEAIQYLEYTERQTKASTGDNPRDIRPVEPRM